MVKKSLFLYISSTEVLEPVIQFKKLDNIKIDKY